MKEMSSSTSKKDKAPSSPLRSVSLATGCTSVDGKAVKKLVVSPSSKENATQAQQSAASSSSSGRTLRHTDSTFLRVTDLDVTMFKDATSSSRTESTIHTSSDDSSSSLDEELWIVLDHEQDAAPLAVQALVQSARHVTLQNPDLWTPVHAKQHQQASWGACSWESLATDETWKHCYKQTDTADNQALVWTGTLPYIGYGSDLPAVRAAGLVDMPPRDLLDLLADSSRVHEYNHMSLGRQDVVVLQEQFTGGSFQGITKIVKSESRVWRNKTLQFTSLLHARELEPHSNTTSMDTTNKTRDYLFVPRAVQGGGSSTSAFASEILLGVNVIRTIPGDDQRCMLISVNHIKSPIPMMIAKRIGLQAATNFIRDVQTLARTRAAK